MISVLAVEDSTLRREYTLQRSNYRYTVLCQRVHRLTMLSLNAKLFNNQIIPSVDQETSLPPLLDEGLAEFPRLWLQWIVAVSVFRKAAVSSFTKTKLVDDSQKSVVQKIRYKLVQVQQLLMFDQYVSQIGKNEAV
jgi:hypothetical protein